MAKDSNEVNKINRPRQYSMRNNRLRAAQADQQLSYVALDVETKPTQREFLVLLGVRTAQVRREQSFC